MRLHYPGASSEEFGDGTTESFIPVSDLSQMLRMASVAYNEHAETIKREGIPYIADNFTDWANYAIRIADALDNATKIKASTVFTDSVYPAPTVEWLSVVFDDGHTCPRCKGGIPNNEKRGAYMGATSRRDGVTEICSDCGNAEAMDDFLASGRTVR
jgi:hypothetical protein